MDPPLRKPLRVCGSQAAWTHTTRLICLSLCCFLHSQLLSSWNNSESASLAASFQHWLRIYSAGELSITSQTSLGQPLLLPLLIPLQLGSTFNFSKSFHIHFLIWPLQQSCEVGRASIIIPIWKTGKMKHNALKWQAQVIGHAGGQRQCRARTESWFPATPHQLWGLSSGHGVITTGAMFIFHSQYFLYTLFFICSRPLQLKMCSRGRQWLHSLRSPQTYWMVRICGAHT